MLASYIRARMFLQTEFRTEKQAVRALCRAADVTGKEFAAARAGRLVSDEARARIWAVFGFEVEAAMDSGGVPACSASAMAEARQK